MVHCEKAESLSLKRIERFMKNERYWTYNMLPKET